MLSFAIKLIIGYHFFPKIILWIYGLSLIIVPYRPCLDGFFLTFLMVGGSRNGAILREPFNEAEVDSLE